jgi:predicted signal transduction protein with EAL and GGDEF domain
VFSKTLYGGAAGVYEISASIGLGLLSGGWKRCRNAHQNAEMAMYQAKDSGNGHIYTISQIPARGIAAQGQCGKTAPWRPKTTAAMIFILYFQPNAFCGIRRYRKNARPDTVGVPRSMIGPNDFIPPAEETWTDSAHDMVDNRRMQAAGQVFSRITVCPMAMAVNITRAGVGAQRVREGA